MLKLARLLEKFIKLKKTEFNNCGKVSRFKRSENLRLSRGLSFHLGETLILIQKLRHRLTSNNRSSTYLLIRTIIIIIQLQTR